MSALPLPPWERRFLRVVREVEAAKQRKILESLRDAHRDRWRAEQERHEMNQADEIAVGMAYASLRDAEAIDAAEGEAADPGDARDAACGKGRGEGVTA